jgi:hypothetical protein
MIEVKSFFKVILLLSTNVFEIRYFCVSTRYEQAVEKV